MSRFIPKIKLVTCDGKGPRAWIRKFIKYFEVYNIHGEHRVAIESPFLIDKSDAWYHNWIQSEGSHSWAEFERELCVRFGEGNNKPILLVTAGLSNILELICRQKRHDLNEIIHLSLSILILFSPCSSFSPSISPISSPSHLISILLFCQLTSD